MLRYSTGNLTEMFKSATIALVYKSGDQQAAANYRQNSLLSIVSKIFEKVIFKQLKSFLKEDSFLPSVQFAYRSDQSTVDALV